MKQIPELSTLDYLFKLENKYENKYGLKPYNVSDWNPSEEFVNNIISKLEIPKLKNAIDYAFSYTNKNKKHILKTLGFDYNKKGCLITPSGSTSILCSINWLNLLGINNINVISPAYFSLFHNCENFNIHVQEHYMLRCNDKFKLPNLPIEDEAPVWITNPIYCTGVHLNNEAYIYHLKDIMDKQNRFLIADECLAMRGNELSHVIGDNKKFIGIYAPHKTISVNGIKFSIIVFDKLFQVFFDQWSDILYGCLPLSSLSAIKHYISDNFIEYQTLFLHNTTNAFNFIKNICSSKKNIKIDNDVNGYLATIYTPNITKEKFTDDGFIWEIMEQTGGSFIMGHRNHFDPDYGMCFRVNLARDGILFRTTITRIINFLNLL